MYFHGTAPTSDSGPSPSIAVEAGVRLFLPTRPGYGTTLPRPAASLQEVAADTISAVVDRGARSIVAMGWSGGGPYALAAAVAAPSIVSKVALLASWAPMEPPHPGLPFGVRVFMRLAQVLPRPALAAAMAVTGRRTPGHIDDVRRVARPWGFNLEDATRVAQVAGWHAEDDPEVPIEPWQAAGVELRPGSPGTHKPSQDLWIDVLRWASQ